eukprot:CAMPEP_0202700928 /NCGR_PEP_ID=MMETSP1385-20130828/14049_1 /ASSEMBLY_ACC=CAM_ASM_000861 /TAXON_ID=933848 /ORGANISM="Elphidium margaritaceum" /LENGTH=482 /DNA_ID=CAMNT_0049358219 /DNA_START=295 /DNA_END=1743 /DNA_ORIENTATION=-
MLFGSMQESLSGTQVFIPDVAPEAFNFFHLLIYGAAPPLTFDIVVHVLYLAQKYLIDALAAECKEFCIAVNHLNDFYNILHAFTRYPSLTFDTFVPQFLSQCKFTNVAPCPPSSSSSSSSPSPSAWYTLSPLSTQNHRNVMKIMEAKGFLNLPIFMVQHIIKSGLVSTEQFKYLHCRQYAQHCCTQSDNDDNVSQRIDVADTETCSQCPRVESVVDSASNHATKQSEWQIFFKQHFMSLIDFSRIKSDFLLSTVRSDSILSDAELLNLWSTKTKRNKPGFNIDEFYLSYDECIQLQPGNRVDVRCCTGETVAAKIVPIAHAVSHSNSSVGSYGGDSSADSAEDETRNKACVVSNHEQEVCVEYYDTKNTSIQEFVALDDLRLMIHGCISSRHNIVKPCMQNLQIHQNVFVNLAYLPAKAYGYFTTIDTWIECKIIGFWNEKKQIKVRSIGETNEMSDGDYYFHPDSKDEVACSLECEYCCYN